MTNEIKVNRFKQIEVVVGSTCSCDVCGKLIEKRTENKIIYCIGSYWELCTGHHDWGNDSIDSIEYFDLCSKECIQKKFDSYLENCCGSEYFELSHIQKMEVQNDE